MSITEAKWKEEQCRVEYGVFFANDECVLLEGSPEDGYAASLRVSVSSLVEIEKDGWVHLNSLLSYYSERSDFVAIGGETSWEGDGFVALIEAESKNLIWVMHLCQSEKFVEVLFDDENIFAASEEYPQKYRWKIPLKNPENLMRVS